MPRTTTLECPGCPPLRALTFDTFGLIKVIEARDNEGGRPRVVEKWGEPELSKGVLTASMVDRKYDPLLAVARKNGTIDVLSPVNGQLCFTISDDSDDGNRREDDPISGLHLFATNKLNSGSKPCTLLTCTTKGKASLRSFEDISSPDAANCESSRTWNVCNSGSVLCSKVDGSENYVIFGGKGVEMNLWDLNECTKTWTSKFPHTNSLGIFTPTWFTSATFLSKDDHRKVVAGTSNHQVRVYDISAQRRPVISFDYRETTIKAVAEDPDGYTVYVGNGSGDLASFDTRTGKLLGSFIGKCSGSIRSIARHPELPVIASCGLDSYLRLWDVKTRQLLSAVFLKQHLVNVIIDSNFSDKVFDSKRELSVGEPKTADEIPSEEKEEEYLQSPKKKKKKNKQSKETKISDKKSKKKHRSDKESMEDEGVKKKRKSKKRITPEDDSL